MAQFQAFEKNVDVCGKAVLSIIKGMEYFEEKALEILAENGIHHPIPEEWYSQQAWLDAFRKIYMEIGPYALYSIGKKIPDSAHFPPDIDSLENALRSIDVAYHMNHRGGAIGNYNFNKSADGSISLVCENPYPCEFDRGIIEGIARKFAPDESRIIVRHDDSAPCRENGDSSCTYHVELLKKNNT